MQSRQAWVVVAFLVLGGLAPAVAAARDFDNPPPPRDPQQQIAPGNVQRDDTPNDPEYDRAEPDDEDTLDAEDDSSNLYDEDYEMFGFPSALTPLARYEDPASPFPGQQQISGYNAAGAWKITRGLPGVTVAVLDTGIKWDNEGVRRRIALNAGELPGVADPDDDGVILIDQLTGQVDPALGGRADALDGQDVIRARSNGIDDDGNGYVDDIAGWDFHDDDNDPADSSSYFAAANHGTGRMNEVAEEGNDGRGSLGLCPRCTVMPIRIWDTFVSDANQFAMGIVFAADNGVSVIEGANGSLYHSAFAESASQYAYDRGVAQVYSGDDLNTGNHNYPANYDHTMLIQGTATDSKGLGTDVGPEARTFLEQVFDPAFAPLGLTLGSQVPVRTYFRGANTTQFGGHSSIAMEGATGSENTGKAAGAAALVISAARAKGVDLSPDETRAILEQTAEDVLPGNTGVAGFGLPDFAQEGWDEHFGWGRADVGRAAGIADAGEDELPPEASIGDPDWYAPLAGATAQIRGLARARGEGFTWTLEWGPGVQPAGGEWSEVRSGTSSGAAVTDFGTVDLDTIRTALEGYTPPPDPGSPVFKPGSPHPYTGQFTVRLRVEAADDRELDGVDRKVLTALDPDEQRLRGGFPKRMGTGGEAALRYADLDGDNGDELLVPLEDGTLHAYRADGSELPGWPVTTRTMAQAAAHATAPGFRPGVLPPAREPLRGPVVGDLTGDGVPEVVTTAGRHVYAWHADGSTVRGFPVSVDLDNCKGEDQQQEDRHRKCGFLAGPALARIEGKDAGLRIVVPALDGHLYALRPDGSTVPGYPVPLVDPDEAEPMLAESINQPAVGDLDGDGADDIVIASNEVYGADQTPPGTISGVFSQALAELLGNATSTSSRVYAVSGKSGEFIDGWPIKLNGGIQNVLPLIGPGHDAAIFRDGDDPVVVVSTTGGALQTRNADGTQREVMEQSASAGTAPAEPALNLFESAVVGDLTGSGSPSIVKYQVDLAQAANLLLVGQNAPYSHKIGAFDPATGTPRPGWPTITDDYQFLSSSTIARVAGGPGASNQVLAGTGLGLLHAYEGTTGNDIGGFPKVTGGWLYSPAALAVDGRLAAITREGFLFEWQTDAPRCQDEWPSFRHDPQASGNYDRDGTAPGAPAGLSLTPVGQSVARYRVRFTRPRDDGLCGGAPAGYEASIGDRPLTLEDLTTTGETVSATVTLPPARTRAAGARATRRTVSVLALDEVGNRGFPARATYDLPDPGDAAAGAGATLGSAVTGAARRCRAGAGFRRVGATPRGRGVRLTFARRVARRVTVDVFQQSIGRRVTGERLVARFTGRRRGVSWSGRANRRGRAVRDGYLFARFRIALPGGGADVRRIALRRRDGRFSRLPGFHRPDRCGRVQSFKLERPVFGGRSGRALGITFRLGRSARVGVTVLRGTRVVRRFATRTRGAGVAHRLRLGARGLPRGTYAVRLRIGATVLTLRARRV